MASAAPSSDEMTAEEIGHFALAAMYSAVDEEGKIAVIARAIRDARREENEACAKVAELLEQWPNDGIADAIRARVK